MTGRHVVQEILPICDVGVRVRVGNRAVKRVYLAPDGVDLPFKSADGFVSTSVDRLDIHSMVVVETEGPSGQWHPLADGKKKDVSWFDQRWRRLLLEFNVRDEPPYLSQLDAEQISDNLAAAGINWCWVHAKDNGGTVFHDTKVAHKNSALGERNFLHEFTKALQARDIRWGFHVNISKDHWMYNLHPEWRQKWQDGTDRGASDINPDWDNMCFNSPYGDYNLRLIRELNAQFQPEAYWIDRLDWGGILPHRFACCCRYCGERFRREIGHRMPLDVDWADPAWQAFMTWRSRSLAAYLRDVVDAARSGNSGVKVTLSTHNGLDMFGYWFHGQDPADVADPPDHITQEIHAEREGFLALSLTPRFTRAVSGGKPMDADIFRHSGDLDFAFKPQAQLLAEALTLCANGAGVMFEDLIYPEGRVEPNTYRHLQPVCREIEVREPWFGGAPVPFVAVHYSVVTRLYFGQEEPGERYLLSFLGACKAMLEAHVPFEIVSDRDITEEGLDRFKALVLPNAACLSESQIAAIERYVDSGGGIVATYMTSLFDERGRRRPNFGLAGVFGADFIDTLALPLSYLRFAENDLLRDGLPADVPLLHRAPQARVRSAKAAQTEGRIVYGQEGLNRLSSACHPPDPTASAYPAAVLRSDRGGRSVYFPGQVDAIYTQWGHPEFKRLLVNAVKWAVNETAPLEVTAPMCVEATLFEQPEHNRLVAHVVNYQPELGRTWALMRTKFVA